MDESLEKLFKSLRKQVGLQRQMLEIVRRERELLVAADFAKIQEVTFSKEALVNSVRKCELERQEVCRLLGAQYQPKEGVVTLGQIIEVLQGVDRQKADELRSTFTALKMLVERVNSQNRSNQEFVESSLVHIGKMKENVLGEGHKHSQTYTPKGKRKTSHTQNSNLVSEEA